MSPRQMTMDSPIPERCGRVDVVAWIQRVFDDCLARAPFGVAWELDGADPPLTAFVTPPECGTGQIRLDRADVGARVDFVSRLQAFLDIELERPVPFCPHHQIGLSAVRAGDHVIWSCPDGDFKCDVGEYELAAFWPPIQHDHRAAPLLFKRFDRDGVKGIARLSVDDRHGRLVARVSLRPDADEDAVREAAAPLLVEVEHVPAVSTVREWRPATDREPAHEVLTVKGAMHRLALLQGSLQRARHEDDCDFLVGGTRVRLIPEHQIGAPDGPVVLDHNGVPFAYEGDHVKCGGGGSPRGPVRGGRPVFNASELAVFNHRARRR